jgi:polyhydroxyalkanoate synthesis regulator phasin
MLISNIGRSAVFFGQQQNTAKHTSNSAAKRSGIMAPEHFRNSETVTISAEAKRLFAQRQEERIAQMELRKTGHIQCDDPYIILNAQDSDLDLMATRLDLENENMSVWREDWRGVASRWGFQASELMLDFYARLQTTLGPSHNFETDFGNMISLANRFSELRQALVDKHDAGEICCEELEAKLSDLDEAFEFAAEVLSRRAEHRLAQSPRIRDDQIGNLQSTRRLLNITGAMRAQLACGATIVFLGDSDDDINTDRVLDTDSHMPLELLLSIRESTSHFAELTRKFVMENGEIQTQYDREWLEDVLRQAPPSENGFTFEEMLERDNE